MTLLTTNQVATMFGVKRHVVDNWVQRETFPRPSIMGKAKRAWTPAAIALHVDGKIKQLRAEIDSLESIKRTLQA